MSAHTLGAEMERIAEKSPVFRALDAKARTELLSLGRPKSFAVNTLLMQEGSPGTSLMVIVKGTVRVSLLTAGGKRFVIDDLQRGEVLGEMAMFDGGVRSADVKAVTNCEVLVLERRDVIPFLEGHPQACLKIVEILSRRLRRANEHMTDIAFVDLPTRLAKLLMRRSSEGDDGAIRKRISDSQSDLAAMIGCSRENVNRCLRDMQKRKIISLEDGWIVILARDELATLSEVS